MSAAEFESLVALFLEGNASSDQVARLRAALSGSPALRARFQASACTKPSSPASVIAKSVRRPE
jgi:hypothetical protein